MRQGLLHHSESIISEVVEKTTSRCVRMLTFRTDDFARSLSSWHFDIDSQRMVNHFWVRFVAAVFQLAAKMRNTLMLMQNVPIVGFIYVLKLAWKS